MISYSSQQNGFQAADSCCTLFTRIKEEGGSEMNTCSLDSCIKIKTEATFLTQRVKALGLLSYITKQN